MVTIELYVIRDVTADDVGPVYQAKNEGVALRQYRNVLKDLNPNISRDEFELWRVGYFTDKMELIPDLKKVNIPAVVAEQIEAVFHNVEKKQLKEVKNG